ncbi:RNA-binding (RRM/RBD/RNP motifs) family protein [Artemisia annua]|uniref:RNA-binding (RRM/RBD/RNP motifs) family protein n=1 Tax=Artemisia annua TaxID=35608 RepID=A0A2U1PG40_ARTAN|nr:RNA-binding (RRM/RBD/RNP motifs) family protein [Artemisia annua]
MGKNKNRTKKHDAGEHSPATVFVNNLPYTFTNSQLEETFSDVGPIRRCFMVTKKGSTEHRGFGYVQFAVTEDANRAIELKHGSSVGGRTVGVKHATHRAPLEQRRPKGNEVVPSDAAVKAKDGEDDMDDDITKTEDSKDDSVLHVDDIVKKLDDNDDSLTPIVKRKKTKDSEEKGKIDKPKKTVIASEDELVEDDSSAPIVKPKKASDSQKKGKVDKPKKVASSLNTEVLEDDSSTPIVKTKKASDSQKKGKADKPKTTVTPSKAERVEGISSEKQRVARTVVVGNLLNTKIAEDAHHLARECGSVSTITYPLPKEELTHHGLLQDGCRLGASSIVYASVKSARACVTKLHQKSINGVTIWARQLGGEGSKVQKWKLIIRNLPFKANTDEIKEMFSAAGFVWDVFIPKNPDSGLAKGFAFCKFTCKQDAENAIQKFNGKSFGKRPIAVDWAVPKNIYTAGSQVDKEDELKESDEEDSDSDFENSNVEKLDKNKNTQHSDEDADVSDDTDLVDDEVNFDEEADVAKKVLNNFLSSVNNDPVPVQRKPDDETVKTQTKISDGPTDAKHVSKPESLPLTDNIKSKPVETEEEMQRTLFISNLPFDITSDEVKQRFAGFGEIQSFFLVLHPVTKRPRGTGFLKFKTLDAADAAFSAATSVAGLGIILKGRQLKVLKALNKKEAHEKEVEKMKKEEVDHRNLYLAKEGLILEGTPAAEGVSESDLSKRRSLEQKKATKLKSPNFHVSKTRLIMYNVPKSMNDKQLKRLCLEAVTSRATKQKPTIRQIKLLKDSNKGKEVSKNHSRGVAFIEFTEHEHALVALRVLNNNPGTFTSEHRPIVEFALDNVQTLRQRDDKIAAQQQGYGNNSERTEKKPDFNKPMDRSNDLSRKRKTPNTFQENRKDKTVETEGKPAKKQEFPPINEPSGVQQEGKRFKSQRAPSDRITSGRNEPSGVQQEGKRFKSQRAPSDRITSGVARPTGVANVPVKKRPREQEQQNIDTNSTKRRKNKEPLGKDTTDKLDMLIEQYRSKFSGNRTNKSDGEKENPRRLGRWFQS